MPLKLSLHLPRILVFTFKINPRHSRIWIGEVTFTPLSVSLLDCISTEYDTKIIFPFSTDTSIHIQIRRKSVVTVPRIYSYTDT